MIIKKGIMEIPLLIDMLYISDLLYFVLLKLGNKFLLFTWFWAEKVKTFFFALHLILGTKWDQIWLKTFLFALHVGQKIGLMLGEQFAFWSLFFSNFLKFLPPPPFF